MSLLLIGSGLLALSGLGAGFAMRRWRRGAAGAAAVPEAASGHAITCPVCLARGLADTKIPSRNAL